MTRLNIHVGPLGTQITNTQKTNNYDMSTQNIYNSQVCYSDESESKSINADEILLNVFSTDGIE